tara:strand:+ start:107 stop:1282 length:1176 start_codon:yes stop_codon:yes gene_type:complete
MKKILLVLIFSIFTTTVFSDVFNTTYKKIPIPEDVNKKTSSPWNFYDDFESEKLNFNLNCGYQKKRTNNEPLYEFKKEDNGNTYIAVTAKKDQCTENDTERSEFETSKRDVREKIVWFGMNMRLPKDFKYIDDRTLLWQFKNLMGNVSPIIAFRLYDKRKIKVAGQIGHNQKINWIECRYKEDSNLPDFYRTKHCTLGYFPTLKLKNNQKLSNGTEKFIEASKEFLKYEEFEPNEVAYVPTQKQGFGSRFKMKLGDWISFKVGVHITKNNNGFVKVFLNDQPIFDYEGPTYDWILPKYDGSTVRFGIYRDANPEDGDINDILNFTGYPNQTVHYDDFVVVSDKLTLDTILDSVEKNLKENCPEDCIIKRQKEFKKLMKSSEEVKSSFEINF